MTPLHLEREKAISYWLIKVDNSFLESQSLKDSVGVLRKGWTMKPVKRKKLTTSKINARTCYFKKWAVTKPMVQERLWCFKGWKTFIFIISTVVLFDLFFVPSLCHFLRKLSEVTFVDCMRSKMHQICGLLLWVTEILNTGRGLEPSLQSGWLWGCHWLSVVIDFSHWDGDWHS